MRRMHLVIGLVGCLTLFGCGGSPAATLAAQNVVDAIKAAGIPVANVQPGTVPDGSPLPRSFKENLTFDATGLTPNNKGGQVFVCDTKQNCDAIYAYFNALKALAGPYLYQSPDGRVVAQIDSGMKAEDAAKIEAAIKALP